MMCDLNQCQNVPCQVSLNDYMCKLNLFLKSHYMYRFFILFFFIEIVVIQRDKDCGSIIDWAICGNNEGELNNNGVGCYCRKAICKHNNDCGPDGVCVHNRCELKCNHDSDCKKYVNIRALDIFNHVLWQSLR